MSTSPSSPNQSLNVPPNHSSPFLPGYLLGDHHSYHHGVTSSPKIWSSNAGQSPSQKMGQSNQLSMTPAATGLLRRESVRGKPGGPPTKTLYSSPTSVENSFSQALTPGSNRNQTTPMLRPMTGTAPPTAGLFQTPGPSRDTSLQMLNQSQTLPISPAQVDPFYTQGDLKSDDVLDETWVTVFGFPPGATSFIIQQFSQYGTILKHVVAAECNWMHIHYLSKLQAKKALSKDGKIFGGCMKIGVTPCIEKAIMEEKSNSSVNDSMRSQTDNNASTPTPIRPLTAAYVASRGEYEVLRDNPTPKRDASLVSKLKEYMFGY
ncbi:nucleoporin NUP35-like isoform X2 [Physella acuta]|nr:nucleoporin NUP35-like isoform X2 [Physella acuta]XP_059175810.1 nucleoporin NUP35-like isoform X2 [Physella acuta]